MRSRLYSRVAWRGRHSECDTRATIRSHDQRRNGSSGVEIKTKRFRRTVRTASRTISAVPELQTGLPQNEGLRIIRFILHPNSKHITTKMIIFNTDLNHNIRIKISLVYS